MFFSAFAASNLPMIEKGPFFAIPWTHCSSAGMTRGMNMALENELETFGRELPRLLAVEGNRGKFALISGERVDSVWGTVEAGLEAGYDRFGLKPFLVKEVTEHEKARFFSRNVTACR
jgi:hypothetical protein